MPSTSIIGSLMEMPFEEQMVFLEENPDVVQAINLGPQHYEAWPYYQFEWQIIDWDDDWSILLAHPGRGCGKTIFLSHAIDQAVHDLGVRRLALIGEDAGKTISVNINGDDGVRACSRTPCEVETNRYGRRELRWKNGAICAIGYAVQIDSIRGTNAEIIAGDEVGFWKGYGLQDARDPMVAIDPALRKGMARMLLATTPNSKSLPSQEALVALKKDPGVKVIEGISTESNVFNNVEKIRLQRKRYENNRRSEEARQELDGEIIINKSLQLWTKDLLDRCHVESQHGPYARSDVVVLSLDPNKKRAVGNDPAGIVVGAIDLKHRKAQILHAEDGIWGPAELHSVLSRLCRQYNVDELLAEDNALGDYFIPSMERFGGLPVRFRSVTAVEDKRLRALDALAEYQNGNVYHCADLIDLDVQLLSFTGVPETQRDHDDMVDALSHLVREYLLPPKKPSIYDFL